MLPPSPSSSSGPWGSRAGQDGEKEEDPQRWKEIPPAALNEGGREGTRWEERLRA